MNIINIGRLYFSVLTTTFKKLLYFFHMVIFIFTALVSKLGWVCLDKILSLWLCKLHLRWVVYTVSVHQHSVFVVKQSGCDWSADLQLYFKGFKAVTCLVIADIVTHSLPFSEAKIIGYTNTFFIPRILLPFFVFQWLGLDKLLSCFCSWLWVIIHLYCKALSDQFCIIALCPS